MINEAVADRVNRLQKTAKRAEQQMLQVRREERRLKLRCIELAEAVKVKRSEAEAALTRRRNLRSEVQQLRAAVIASESADSARLEELHRQIVDLETNIMKARSAPLDIGLSSSLMEAEQAAREEERRKWKVRCFAFVWCDVGRYVLRFCCVARRRSWNASVLKGENWWMKPRTGARCSTRNWWNP